MKAAETAAAAARDCSVTELHEAMGRGGIGTLIDVREFAEYAAGRVPGAKLIPLGEVEWRADEIDRAQPVYVMCRTGRRSGEARHKLKALGFGDVRNVTGGLTAWRAAGYAVERDERAPWSIERQVRFTVGMIVIVGVLLSVTVAQPFVWLSGFIGAALVVTAALDWCGMALVLARMPWNRPANGRSARTGAAA